MQKPEKNKNKFVGKPKTEKKAGAILPKGVKGTAARKFLADAKAAKNQVKNDNRKLHLVMLGKAPVSFAASRKGHLASIKADHRRDTKEIHRIKNAYHVRTYRRPKTAAELAREKADHAKRLINAKTEYAKSSQTKTLPDRSTVYITPQGNKFTGKDVRQAAFFFHVATQKPVGYKLADGSNVKKKQDRHPKEFQNREQGPAHDRKKPLTDISGTGQKYREYGIVHDKKIGYDGRSPNPTETRLIMLENTAGVHEFAGVVAHPDSTREDRNDHHLVSPI